MKNIIVLIKNNLKIAIIKKPIGFIMSIIAPILILLLMLNVINMNSGYITVGIIDNDSSKTSKDILDSIKNYEGFNVREIQQNEKKDLFSENAINAVIEVTSGFEDSLLKGDTNPIKITSVENDDVGMIIRNLVNEQMSNINSIAIAAEGNKEVYYKSLDNYSNNSYIKLERESLNDLHEEYSFSQTFIGFIIMFMLIRGMSTSYRVFKEKEENVYNRIFMAPIKTYEYYVADAISGYISILLQVSLSIIGIKFVKVQVGVSTLELFAILSLVGLVSISLAICCRSFAKNITEASNIFNFANIIMVMIGGAFVPIEIMPPIIEKISYFTPVRWAIQSIIDIQQGASFNEIYKYLIIIVLFAVAFFVIGIYKTSKEERKLSIN
ncbi:ABC transporter permease [Clostridium sp. MB05]|uniref:ABC transporter permease n=1 Tax=Clostridium sp. MB05 TaxID=3376682 RepID=UPI003982B3E9